MQGQVLRVLIVRVEIEVVKLVFRAIECGNWHGIE